jgi:hypothetical protein
MSAPVIHETPSDLWIISGPRTITLLDLVADLFEDGVSEREVVEYVIELVGCGKVHLIGQVVARDLLVH